MSFILALALAFSCQEKPQETIPALEDATSLKAEQVDPSSVKLTWSDNAEGEKGYRVFIRKETDSYNVEPLETIAAESTEYTFTNLSEGAVYDFGVQAVAEDFTRHSKVVYLNDYQVPVQEEPETPVDPEKPVEPEVPAVDPQTVPQVTKVTASYAYIAVSYKVEKLAGSNPEHGVCFSTSGTPTVDDIKVLGPQLPANKEILQVVPNAYLEDGKEYNMSVFVKNGQNYIYSEPQSVSLGAQPEEISLEWEKQNYDIQGVEIYKTTSQLNGRNLNAWYAVADPSVVDFRVLYPETVGSKKTISSQAEPSA